MTTAVYAMSERVSGRMRSIIQEREVAGYLWVMDWYRLQEERSYMQDLSLRGEYLG